MRNRGGRWGRPPPGFNYWTRSDLRSGVSPQSQVERGWVQAAVATGSPPVGAGVVSPPRRVSLDRVSFFGVGFIWEIS